MDESTTGSVVVEKLCGCLYPAASIKALTIVYLVKVFEIIVVIILIFVVCF